MYAVEFETDITEGAVQIPAHLLKNFPEHRLVKVIMLLPEANSNDKQRLDLKSKILSIGKNCISLPLLDSRTPDEILDYDENGLPT